MKRAFALRAQGSGTSQAATAVMGGRRATPPWDAIVESTPAFVGEPENIKADSARPFPLFRTAEMERA